MTKILEIEYSKVCLELEQILKKAEQRVLNFEDVKLSRDRLKESNEIYRQTVIAEELNHE